MTLTNIVPFARVLPQVGKLVMQYRAPAPGILPAVRTGTKTAIGYTWGQWCPCNGLDHARKIALQMNAEPFNFRIR